MAHSHHTPNRENEVSQLVEATERNEHMVQVIKLGYVALETNDIAAMQAYYTDVIGLTLAERGDNGAVYFRNAFDYHTIALYPGEENRLRHFGLQLDGQQSIKEVAAQLKEQGIKAELRTDAEPGLAQLLQLEDSEGNTLQLYTSMLQVDHGFSEKGIMPEKLGHLGLSVHDPERVADFYQHILGFRVSDRVEDYFVFLRCGPDHHTLNLMGSRDQKLNHIAFQLKDWAHVQMACEHLGKRSIPLLWGPGRHGPGHNIFTYHRDPNQHVIELFTELDLMLNEELGYFEPRPWHEDHPQKPKHWLDGNKAAIAWGTPLPANFTR
jgi:catechol-2,3-dioxygenase